jgi:hypothetical protein
MKSVVKAGLLAASMLLSPLAAHASTFVYGSYSVTDQQNVIFFSPTSETAGAGMITLHGTGANAGQDITAWCIDLFDILKTSATYNVVPLTNAGSGTPNPTLTNAQLSEMGSLMIQGAASVPGESDHNGSAAFQLAIWSVEYGGALLDSASGPLATLVAQLVTNVEPGGIWYCPGCSVDQLDAAAQNQILAFGVPSQTPIPASLWLFASGAGLLGLMMRKRKGCIAGGALAGVTRPSIIAPGPRENAGCISKTDLIDSIT